MKYKTNKIVTSLSLLDTLVGSGQRIMAGGFMGVGGAVPLLNYLATKELHQIHLICSDAGLPGVGVGALLAAKSISELTASHVGLNKDVSTQVNEGNLTLHLVPQGSFVEKIRAAGAGLGGVLTPTGIGTDVARDKEIITVEGQDYLLELPMRADVAILRAHTADTLGNLVIEKTCKNFNVVMATAADRVIVQVDRMVEVGSIDPDQVTVPHFFVDHLVPREMLKKYEGLE